MDKVDIIKKQTRNGRLDRRLKKWTRQDAENFIDRSKRAKNNK